MHIILGDKVLNVGRYIAFCLLTAYFFRLILIHPDSIHAHSDITCVSTGWLCVFGMYQFTTQSTSDTTDSPDLFVIADFEVESYMNTLFEYRRI